MRCCVQGCKNDSRHLTKSNGITFHIFPYQPSIRAAWLKAIGKEDWEPKDRSAVCSEHFLSGDLYETKNGLRKVRVGAVPMIVQDAIICDYIGTQLDVCRICLVSDRKLYPIKLYNLQQAFENVTGLLLAGQKLPQTVCLECAWRLLKSNSFRNKCIRATSLMLEIIKQHDILSDGNINTINREKHQLCSPLSTKHNETNKFDVKLKNTEPEARTYLEEPSLDEQPIDIEIKDENDLLDEEFDQNPIGNNELGQMAIRQTAIIQNPIGQLIIAPNIIGQFTIRPNAAGQKPIANAAMTRLVIEQNVIGQNVVSQDVVQSDTTTVEHNTIENTEVGQKETGENETEHDKEFGSQNNNDFLVSDRDYTSDDSLPLQKTRKKKKIQKKVVQVRKKKLKNDPVEPKIDRRRKPFLDETLFTVTALSYEEQIAEISKRQESSNYKNNAFKCTECFKGFLDEDAYNTHMLRHTDKCGTHACEICKTHFKDHHALRKHITAHHSQRYSCNQCTYVTNHRQTARLHERWHIGTKYKCPHCQEEFSRFTTYMGHIRIKHPSDFVCEICGYSFVSEKGIDLHKKLKHQLYDGNIPDDGPYCEPCKVRFVSKEAYKRHVNVSARHNITDSDKAQREANKPKPGRKTRETVEKEKRQREQNREPEEKRKVYPSQLRKAEGPISCEQCGLQLEDSRAYHSHFRRSHPDKNRTKYPSMKSPCMCEVCGRIFQSFALLRDHTWVHTGERPFKCDMCDKSFRMKQRLVAHRRVHSDVKPTYLCTLCGKNFSTHSNRQRHMFIHTGLKPFKCEMCDKRFKHATEKRAHVSYVHLKKPWPKRARGKRRSDRQGPMPPLPVPPSASEMDIQPIWPPCDPKLSDMNTMMDDKPMYYNLKL